MEGIKNIKSKVAQANHPRVDQRSVAPQKTESFKDAWSRIQTEVGAKPKEQRQPKKRLDSQDLMNLMIHQMKLQDPTKPFDMTKMGQEIAQITSVENLKNIGEALKKMDNKDRGLEHLAMTNLIGKTVTVDRNQFEHQKGQAEHLSFNLPRNAESVKVEIYSSQGKKVFDRDLGPMDQGQGSFSWNGKEGNTPHLVDSGRYHMRINAVDSRGSPIQTETVVSARVIGVNYSGEEPVFLVGDNKNQQRVKFSAISKIEDPTLTNSGAPTFNAAKVDPEKLERMQKHIKAIEESQKAEKEEDEDEKAKAVASKKYLSETKGFPNGLPKGGE